MSESEILEDIRDRIGKDNLFSGNSFRRGRCGVNLTGVSEIRFRGQAFEIKTARCGGKLADVL